MQRAVRAPKPAHVRALVWLMRAGITGIREAPDALLRATFGAPPRSDRGVEQDLRTHAILALSRLAKLGEIHHMGVAKARRSYAQNGGLLDAPIPRLAQLRNFELPGPGGSIRCRLYRPHSRPHSRPLGSPAPMLVWLHGGGFTIGDLDTHAAACATLADRARVLVVAVDYRKGPEHRFPAAPDDALASLRWLREHADELGADPSRIAVGGDSAGANLSAGLCHRLRDAGEDQPALQVLVYPMTQQRAPFPSRTEFAVGHMLSGEMIEWFSQQYLRGPEDGQDPLVSPLLSPRFDDLAPAIVRTAGFDPLRDEGHAYAERLREAGVDVDERCHEALIHGYLTMAGVSRQNADAVDELAEVVRARLGA